ncbi:MAG: hypothetical protein ACT4QC_19355 [Planctomycetaceae bacterium]
MVQVDEEWDRLKESAKSNFAPGRDNENSPAQAALQLTELFRELARSQTAASRGAQFLATAKAAERDSAALERALALSSDSAAREAALLAFRRAAADCKSCHAAFRDGL